MKKRDFDRGLNDRGIRGAALMGDHIRKHGVAWDRVLASPAERVRRTIEAALPGADPVFDERLYLASAETIFECLADKAGGAGAVLVVEHNPGLREMLFELVAPANATSLFDEAVAKTNGRASG